MDFTSDIKHILELAIWFQVHTNSNEMMDFIMWQINSRLENIFNEGFTQGLTQGKEP